MEKKIKVKGRATDHKNPPKVLKRVSKLRLIAQIGNKTDCTFESENRVYSRGGVVRRLALAAVETGNPKQLKG